MKYWRIGAVSYLNTKPLVQGLAEAVGSAGKLSYALPSVLADQLAVGELDAALIPSIETFSNPDYETISNACIACRGPVWSVKLFSRVPIHQIQSLSLDEGSRTSVALARILLKTHFQVDPQLEPLAIDDDWLACQTDAVLLIGDRAMKPQFPQNEHGGFVHEIDLGKWWHDWTGLPFVFAMWTVRKELVNSELAAPLERWLTEARDRGVHDSGALARQESDRYGLSYQECRDYFDEYLHFRMGPAERTGFAKFRQCVKDLSLFSPRVDGSAPYGSAVQVDTRPTT